MANMFHLYVGAVIKTQLTASKGDVNDHVLAYYRNKAWQAWWED